MPVAVLPMRVLPSVLKLPICVKTDPSDPTVVEPIFVKVVPSDETLVVSESFCRVSPVSDTANRPKICQKDMVISLK
jgi:hypothetical protein